MALIKLEDDPILLEAIKIIPKEKMSYFVKSSQHVREMLLILYRPAKIYPELQKEWENNINSNKT